MSTVRTCFVALLTLPASADDTVEIDDIELTVEVNNVDLSQRKNNLARAQRGRAQSPSRRLLGASHCYLQLRRTRCGTCARLGRSVVLLHADAKCSVMGMRSCARYHS